MQHEKEESMYFGAKRFSIMYLTYVCMIY